MKHPLLTFGDHGECHCYGGYPKACYKAAHDQVERVGFVVLSFPRPRLQAAQWYVDTTLERRQREALN